MRLACLVGAVWIASTTAAQAHFLWLVAQPAERAQTVEARFSETAAPDDPELLAKFAGLKTIATKRGRDGVVQEEIPFTLREKTLSAELPKGISSPLTAQHTWGVVSRGGESFLLKYYAKAYPATLPGQWSAVNDVDLAAFEITPTLVGTEVSFRVTWQGKPVVGDQFVIEGPGIADKIQGTTADNGSFRCRLPERGLYSIRVRHQEAVAGTHGDDSYASVRHYATLSLEFSPIRYLPMTQAFPDLPRGVTSFGAAVASDDLYVYGGHFGSAHHYSHTGQSDEFRRLSLTRPDAKWETLPAGPKLTGVALVSHQGRLYRIGGFTAKNGDDEPQSLWSQDGFARFDPQSNQWTDLPALPEPRSSHDACVLDGKLYVAGGWKLAGPDTVWHDTAWVCDLAAPKLAWMELPHPPFHRRALSLAAHQGQLYVLGGMQQSGTPTTRVDRFDPATRQWSVGPSLIGPDMEGFGTASCEVDGRLIVTTMSGSVQQSSTDGNSWEIVGQLTTPRFFHRQLPLPRGGFLAVAGASMQTGKTSSVEAFGSGEDGQTSRPEKSSDRK